MLDIKIEKMTEADIKSVSELENECFSKPWSEASIEEELYNNNALFLVAKLNDRIVGYIGMHIILDEGYITNIAVNLASRHMGVGKSLLKYVCDYATANNFTFVTLEVRKSNIAAINLYRQFGFKEVGTRKNFYSDPQEDAILLTKYIRRTI